MWWVYFSTTAEAATGVLASAADPGRLARAAYTYSHLPMVAGIIVAAVGDELLLAHPSGHAEPALLITIVGGPGLFLAGSALFNRLICGTFPRSHTAGVLLLAAGALVAPLASPLVLGALTTGVLAGVGICESARPS